MIDKIPSATRQENHSLYYALVSTQIATVVHSHAAEVDLHEQWDSWRHAPL